MKWLKLFASLLVGNLAICYQAAAGESNSSEQTQNNLEKIPLVLGWTWKPPYTTSPTNESLDFGVAGMARDATIRHVLVECGYYIKVEYQVTSKNFETEFEMLEQLRQNIVHIALPIFEDANNRKYSEFPFVKLHDYPGTEFITNEEDATALRVVMHSVLKSWPLLVVILVLTSIAGIIMWALDTNWNSEEFSRSFIKGSWDGFWWSFISVTTVGYGDKTPKSIVARLFSIIWIMVGLIVMAIFTANVTTALTAASIDQEPSSLQGYKIGVLGNGTEYQHALLEDTHPKEYQKIEDIVKAMNTKEVDGMMLDHYTASYYQKKDKLKSLVTVMKFDLRREVGLLFSKDTKFLANCLIDHRSNIWRLVETITADFQLKQQKPPKSVCLFDQSSPLIKQFLYILLGILGVFILLGTLWEYFVRKMAKIKRNVAAAMPSGTALSKGKGTIREEMETVRVLFRQLEEQLSKMEAKAMKLGEGTGITIGQRKFFSS